MEVSPATRADLKRYQDVAERLRVVLLTKQQVQVRLSEIEGALRELQGLKSGDRVYKVVGSIIVSKSVDEVVKELNEAKESLELRLQALSKQESLLKKQLEDLERRLTRRLGGGGSAG